MIQTASLEVLLATWGRWAARQTASAVGFPSVSPMFRDAPSGKGHGSAPPAGVGLGMDDDDIEAVNAAIGRLPGVLRLAVIEVYHYQCSLNKAGVRMGISPHSVGKYLAEAYRRIDEDLAVQACVIDCMAVI